MRVDGESGSVIIHPDVCCTHGLDGDGPAGRIHVHARQVSRGGHCLLAMIDRDGSGLVTRILLVVPKEDYLAVYDCAGWLTVGLDRHGISTRLRGSLGDAA